MTFGWGKQVSITLHEMRIQPLWKSESDQWGLMGAVLRRYHGMTQPCNLNGAFRYAQMLYR